MMHKIKQFYGKIKVVTYYKVHFSIEDYQSKMYIRECTNEKKFTYTITIITLLTMISKVHQQKLRIQRMF